MSLFKKKKTFTNTDSASLLIPVKSVMQNRLRSKPLNNGYLKVHKDPYMSIY